jgi:hypothetical protein
MIRQSQTAATGTGRAAARIDFWEGQRPRLTQISSTANAIFLSVIDL